jgi:peroxiredoxin Q/BCP
MAKVIEGAKAPDFELASTKGPVGLSDFAGKLVVLYFYPKDDTPGCTNEAKDFSALMPKFEEAGVQVMGVSKDSLKSHEKFAAKYGLTAPWVLTQKEKSSRLSRVGWKRNSMVASTWASIVPRS